MERSNWHVTAVFAEGVAWEPGVRQRQAAALAAAIGVEKRARLPDVELGKGTITVRFVVLATGPGSALRLGVEVVEAATWAAPQLLGELLRETVRADADDPQLDLRGEVARRLGDPPSPLTEEWIERTRWTREGYYGDGDGDGDGEEEEEEEEEED